MRNIMDIKELLSKGLKLSNENMIINNYVYMKDGKYYMHKDTDSPDEVIDEDYFDSTSVDWQIFASNNVKLNQINDIKLGNILQSFSDYNTKNL
jgi:hypothetical protein